MPNTLVLLARITVQVSASKVSATMTDTIHQQQVFSQVLPVIDFKLMHTPLLARKPHSLLTYVYSSMYFGGYL